jgi:hypothetical protein
MFGTAQDIFKSIVAKFTPDSEEVYPKTWRTFTFARVLAS